MSQVGQPLTNITEACNAMKAWQKIIGRGRYSYERGEYDSACIYYQRAKRYAEKVFHHSEDKSMSASAVIVSYLDMAELYDKTSNAYFAYIELVKVHEFFAKALEDKSLGCYNRRVIEYQAEQSYLSLNSFVPNQATKSYQVEYKKIQI